MDGTLTKTDDGYALRFEREIAQPVDRVWAALTQPPLMKDWLSENAEVDLRVGGKVVLHDHEIDSTITALAEPHLFAYEWNGPDWNGGIVRWELTPSESGTRLVLTHDMPAMSEAEAEQFRKDHPDLPEGWAPVPSTLAGWHAIVDRLVGAMEGSPVPMDMDRWRRLHEHYKETVSVRHS